MFYRFNAHKHSAPNHNKMAGKDHDDAARKIKSVLIKIQQRWVKFTDINRGDFPRILLMLIFANLGCASVLLLLCVIMITGAGPARILPVYDRIRAQTIPRSFIREEYLDNQAKFELYMDSLERAFLADSINQTQTLNK